MNLAIERKNVIKTTGVHCKLILKWPKQKQHLRNQNNCELNNRKDEHARQEVESYNRKEESNQNNCERNNRNARLHRNNGVHSKTHPKIVKTKQHLCNQNNCELNNRTMKP